MDRQSRAARVEHYRNKAEETRVIARSMKDAEMRRFLRGVASDYEMLAKVLQNLNDPLPASE